MSTLRSLLAPCALSALLVGLTACGPSPEEVCEHVIELLSKDLDAKGMKLEDDKRSKSLESCTERAAKSKREGAMEYKKEAACMITASSLQEVKACSDPGAASPAGE